MSSGIFGIGTSALQAYQHALSVTGHNIANAGTEGYSRQRLDLAVRNPQFAGVGWFGQGVDMAGVNRIMDQFVQFQLNTNTSGAEQQKTFFDYARRMDDLLADADAGLAPAMQRFFASIQDVANDPTSIAARQVLLSEAESLADRFAYLHRRIEDQRQVLEGQIGSSVSEINSLAEAIAGLNKQIVEGTGQSGGRPPNDLLDRRDSLVQQLAGLVSVQTMAQDDGALNVLIGNGQSLVVGTEAARLGAVPSGADPSRNEIALLSAGTSIRVTEFLNGGQLGALLDVRRDLLDPAQNALGQTAVGLAMSFNALHAEGVDLDGLAGGDFFRVPEPQILPARGNAGTGAPAVSFTDVGALTKNDYRLDFDGVEWRLTRVGSPTVLAAAPPGGSLAAEGLEIDLAALGGAAAGDAFEIRPTRQAAARLALELDSPRSFAAALAPTDPAASVPGDNRNALALAALAGERVLANGTTSLSASYNQLVADVGVKTRQSKLSYESQQRLLDASRAQRESISGVNLDEEAANLLRFQQAYAASAQVIAVAGTLFDTLLMAVRR